MIGSCYHDNGIKGTNGGEEINDGLKANEKVSAGSPSVQAGNHDDDDIARDAEDD